MYEIEPRLTQGSNPGIPHCRQILYWLSQQGILEWAAYSFYRVWDDDTNFKNEKEIVFNTLKLVFEKEIQKNKTSILKLEQFSFSKVLHVPPT